MMITGAELELIVAGIGSIAAYTALVMGMSHLLHALTLGAAAVAVVHGAHAGFKLAKGLEKIKDSELRALVRVNYNYSGKGYKETFVIRKEKQAKTLKIYKVETGHLLFHRKMATTYNWTINGAFQTVGCRARQSGFVSHVVTSGLVTGDVQYKCLRMRIGDLIGMTAAALPAAWTGLVAELREDGLMETKCNISLKHKILSGTMALRYFEELSPIMTAVVDVF